MTPEDPPELGIADDRLRAALDAAPGISVLFFDLDMRIEAVYGRTMERHGYVPEQIIGRRAPDVLPAGAWERFGPLYAHALGGETETVVVTTHDGSATYATTYAPVRRDGEVIGGSVTSRAIDPPPTAEASGHHGTAWLEGAFAAAPVATLIGRLYPGETSTVIVHCNEAFGRAVGRDPADVVGMRGSDLIHADDQPARRRMTEQLAGGAAAALDLRCLHADGHDVWMRVAVSTVEEPGGSRLLIAQVVDISERKLLEDRLRHTTAHDPLTGLLNRGHFETALEEVAGRMRGRADVAALVRIDLDGFRAVNDSLGHVAGDEVLAQIGAALRDALDEEAVLARVGGDEFAVLLPATDADGALAVAEELLRIVRALGRITVPDGYAEVTASAGITTWRGLGGEDPEEILAQADIALAEAKATGRDRALAYERSERRRAQLTRHGRWVGRLRRAIRDEQFVLHAQPIVPLGTPASPAEKYELLVRLQAEHRLIAPGVFLEHAERHGLIGDVDRWVLGEAVSLIHDAHAVGRRLELSVNFSAQTMQDTTVVDHLAGLLAARPVPPGALTVEMTETAAITDLGRAEVVARALRDHGCLIALDDFGAGFASLSYAKHLAFDVLKIDGEFISELTRSHSDQLVVRAIVDIARGLGAATVAEYVADQETVELLAALGVDHGQGYFLGRPAPLPDRR
jgi:diguanylate cyclase (GGDEF)-like protein/PAS domain S-box-containing protein